MTYDSRPDTYAHIAQVQKRMIRMIESLQLRLLDHDRSKLESPEREAFDEWSPKLAELTYGSDEYRAALAAMKPALAHHYAANPHHPEHHEEGIRGMDLLDLLEMLCDWSAAGMRHKDNAGLVRSIELNQQRFGYSDELAAIFRNTATLLDRE